MTMTGNPVEQSWDFYIIADIKTWADNAVDRSPIEYFGDFESAKARFDELRSQAYNSEPTEPDFQGRPPARLTLGMEQRNGMEAVDVLHVRQGKNYLVPDFMKMDSVKSDPAATEALARISKEIGFDIVQEYDSAGKLLPAVPFKDWTNTCF